MSMLAGPRRKQKVINLRAKNNAWSNDNSKFGQRMLEKMGWSSGKGLGANENGIVEHVVARYKNDEKGLGFEDKNDQWTKHEDDFNVLLANLSNGDSNEEKLHSGISLEDKSKKSKARVHYHKFTRGKDLTRYSEKDLANIFGKKSFKNEEKVEEVQNEDIQTTEQKFTEKGSMEDYFKNKLAALKSSKLSAINVKKDDYEADYGFKGFAGTIDKDENDEGDIGFQGFGFYNTNTNDSEVITENNDNDEKKSKKKKKSKKQDTTEYENQENNVQESSPSDFVEEGVILEPVKKKKTKKKKQENANEAEEEPKKKKSKIETPSIDEVGKEYIEQDNHVPKKKKKRKNKDNE